MTPVCWTALMLGLALAGCTADTTPKSEPSFYRSMAQPDAQLDAAAAASMITGYRANNGLSAVSVDPELMKLAQEQAAVMAKRDKLDHSAGRPFAVRLKTSGVQSEDRGRECRRRLSYVGGSILRLAQFAAA